MPSKFTKRINRWRFKRSVKKIGASPFCLISNNCLGRRIYTILDRPYNTPFIGLFMMPACFAKLVADFESLMAQDLIFAEQSQYPHLDTARNKHTEDETPYPIGLLGGDIEIHFLHYKDEEEATTKWNKRRDRIDHKNLSFILVANGEYDDKIISEFLHSSPERKVIFHCDPSRTSPRCVYIPSKEKDMGNLYSQYQRFVGRFSFSDWLTSTR